MALTRFNPAKLTEETQRRFATIEKRLRDELVAAQALTADGLVDEWRAAETKRLLDLARRLRSKTEVVSDDELSSFSTRYKPSRSDAGYAVRRAEEAIPRHLAYAEKVLSYVRALHCDEDGSVSLAAADLRRVGWPADA